MKIIELLEVYGRDESVYLKIKDDDFEKFIIEFRKWKDNYNFEISLFNYLKSKNLQVEFMESDYIISEVVDNIL